jgi:hypothetical protein
MWRLVCFVIGHRNEVGAWRRTLSPHFWQRYTKCRRCGHVEVQRARGPSSLLNDAE